MQGIKLKLVTLHTTIIPVPEVKFNPKLSPASQLLCNSGALEASCIQIPNRDERSLRGSFWETKCP